MVTARDAVNEVLRSVEYATGTPVVVVADPTLKVIATIKAAGPSGPAHLLRVNPSAQAQADYLTVFQCGFILRMAALDPAEQYEVGSTPEGRKQTERLLRDHGRRPGAKEFPKAMRESVRDQFYDGLIRQLRSVPLGLRVDSWIISKYPSLADQQRAITLRQLRENLQALSPELRKIAPPKVYDGNGTMNAAFAAFWAKAWNDPVQASPFKAAGLLDRGQELVSIMDRVPTDPSHDRTLIEEWGNHLGLAGWFAFVPYRY